MRPPSRWIVVLVVALLGLFGGLRSAASSRVGGDFLRYHRAGRLVATGDADRLYDREWLRAQKVYAEERAAERAAHGRDGERFLEEEFKYLPATAVLMAPLGALHPRTAWALWGAWNGALIGVTFCAAWAFASQGASWRWMLVPAIVLLRAASDNHNLGQLNPSAIAPATVAVWALDRGRDRAAGLLAAFGGVVKFYPLALALVFAAKRRWTALAALAAGFVVLAAALPAVVLGPSRFAALTAEHREQRAKVYTEAAPPDVPGHSVKSFVYRVFGGVHYQTGSGDRRIDRDVSVAHADPETLRAVVGAVSLALAALALWTLRGPVRGATDPRGPPEAGVFFCVLLLASPEARSPHFLYLAIPMAALTYAIVRGLRTADGSRARVVAAAVLGVVGAILVNCESESMLGRELANELSAWCVQGWATVAVLAALLLVLPPRRAAPAAV